MSSIESHIFLSYEDDHPQKLSSLKWFKLQTQSELFHIHIVVDDSERLGLYIQPQFSEPGPGAPGHLVSTDRLPLSQLHHGLTSCPPESPPGPTVQQAGPPGDSLLHSHWSRNVEARLSLVESLPSDACASSLCHKEPARASKAPY